MPRYIVEDSEPEGNELEVESTYSSHLDRMSNALENGLFSDVTFIVGSKGEEVRGHKAIICIGGSPIFQALLTGKSFDGSPISIPDIQPSGFKHLLKYFYLGKIQEIPEQDYMEFFRAVKYFKVEELYKICREHILEKLALENVIDVFENGKLLEEKELEEAADGFIKLYAESILAQPKFIELSHKDLLHFISSDDFSAPEVPLFRAVHKWGEAECKRQNLEKSHENLRLVLKTIIPQIRFPMMNSGDFAFEIAKLKLLTLEETVDVYNYFFAQQYQRHQNPEEGRFISKPRIFVNYEDEDKASNVVWTGVGGINTGLRTDTIYTISNKGVSTNYLMVYSDDKGRVETNDLSKFVFGGECCCSTFWFIRPGSEPNTYTLFSKYKKGYLTWQDDNSTRAIGPEDKLKLTDAENLNFEPAKNAPGYFVITSGIKNPDSDKPLVLSFGNTFGAEFSNQIVSGSYRNHFGGGFYAKFIEKPNEEVDSILWTIQKIK